MGRHRGAGHRLAEGSEDHRRLGELGGRLSGSAPGLVSDGRLAGEALPGARPDAAGVVRYPDESPENLLDFADKRSIDNFLKLGRSGGPPCDLPIGRDELLVRQRWITDPLALRELGATLSARDAAVYDGPDGR